jgi:hypothetical protein
MAVTKTLNPLHFEDLEPKRFEDLVRELIYDFRDWYKIEPTGRTGSDEGYDARAWEKSNIVINNDEEENDEIDAEEGKHALEGNLWMIQCKREKEVGPKRVSEIIDESIKTEIPYGYLLAAPVNFSKKSYDMFRESLRDKGVMEFFLWGKGDLEHALMMPKNDRILFAFFGVSLLIKRRSHVSEIRFSVNNKNKVLRLIGNNPTHESILLRHIEDSDYPYEEKSIKEKTKPKWGEQIVIELHPRGLVFQIHEYYGYYDEVTNGYAFTKVVDLVHRPKHEQLKNRESNWQNELTENEKVEYFYQNLPRRNQAKMNIYGFLSYEDMLFIDPKGDNYYEIPHIYVEYDKQTGPFTSIWSVFSCNGKEIKVDKNIKQPKVFPKKFPEIKRGKIYKDKYIEWNSFTSRQFTNGNIHRFYDIDQKYKYLKPKDVIAVKTDRSDSEDEYAQVTYKYVTTAKQLVDTQDQSITKESLERELGRSIKESDQITVFEVIRVYSWKLKDSE